MGRKKKKPVKPWCWYCNREFDDDKILVQHQRAKHFKCPFCHKKLYSGPGLTVHCIQVHKEHLDKIPEALPNRNSVDIDIYGMQGIPEEDVREHERLKRGVPENASQKPQDNQNRANSSKSNSIHQPQIQNVHAMSAMHAAMYQHAMSMGGMPPPPNFLVPPGMPPPGFPPGLMPPLGFPPNPALLPLGMTPQPSILHPGIPNFQSPMLPPPTLLNATHMGYAPPPPPPSPPPISGVSGPSTSNSSVPPPPMSGVGHLIGIPPPNYNPSSGRLLPISSNNNSRDTGTSDHHLRRSPKTGHKPENKAHSSFKQPESSSKPAPSSAATISKPPQTISATETKVAPQQSENFIDIPSLKARIMHPNNDLSLEEMRLGLSKYRSMLENIKNSPSQELVTS